MISEQEKILLYNKIMNLEILVETLLETLIDRGDITYDEFQDLLKKNVDSVQAELKKGAKKQKMQKPKDDVENELGDELDDDLKEKLNNMMWGLGGDA